MGRRLSYTTLLDSPSKQLFLELSRDLENIQLSSVELKKEKAYERRSFYERSEQKDQELEAVYNAALDKVAAQYDRNREEAEGVLKEHLRVEEEKRLRAEEEARKEHERIEQEKAEKLRREQEEAARLEAERKAQEEAKKKAEEEAERARKAAQEAEERKEHERLEEEKRKAAEREAEAAKQAQIEQETEQQKKRGISRLTENEAQLHQRYLELHKKLKEFRKWLRDQSKSNPTIKQNMGEMRRTIKKCVGQLREGKGANKKQLQEIKVTLEKAATIAEPSVDIRQFMVSPPEHIANSDDNNVPALLIYMLNILSKCLISSLLTEAGINPNHAEPIGIVAAQIYSMDAFIYKGCPMADILWAKYRVVCPALWGFNGDEKTEAGKVALGWWRQEPGGPFVTEQTHAERMTALGAGFAALTLRNFGKTQRKNPFPNTMFWYSMHKILSIPPNELQETHISLLAAMLRSSAERIVGFFGNIGLALMRKAIVDLPKALPRQTMGVNKLKLLKDLYKREKNILI